MKFNIVLESAEEGGFIATVPYLDGCFTHVNTEKKAIDNGGSCKSLKKRIVCHSCEGRNPVFSMPYKTSGLPFSQE